MTDERVKLLREKSNMSQSELASKLGITRSSVNAWEMGISIPSTQYIVALSNLFKVSTDFILGTNIDSAIGLKGLDESDIKLVYELVQHLQDKNKKK